MQLEEGRGIGKAVFPFFYDQLVFLSPSLTSSRSNMVGNFVKDIKQGIIGLYDYFQISSRETKKHLSCL